MKKYKAGQTIYIVQRDWDPATWLDTDTYSVSSYVIQEKNPYKEGQILDFRMPRKLLNRILSRLVPRIKDFKICTSRRKALSLKKTMELSLHNGR